MTPRTFTPDDEIVIRTLRAALTAQDRNAEGMVASAVPAINSTGDDAALTVATVCFNLMRVVEVNAMRGTDMTLLQLVNATLALGEAAVRIIDARPPDETDIKPPVEATYDEDILALRLTTVESIKPGDEFIVRVVEG